MTDTGRLDIKDYAIAFAMLVVLCSLAAAGRYKISGQEPRGDKMPINADYSLVAPDKFEPIKAEIINDAPATFTIDVETMANLSANDEAPVFAVYTGADMPEQCGDFRKLELNYKKPSQYQREFDLTKHEDVIQAIENHGCVVMRNVPSKG